MSNPAALPFEAVARHVGLDDVPWIANPAHPGAEMRLLQADLEAGLCVMAGRLPGGLRVNTHRHIGSVHMFTLSGAWKYLEHEYVNRAGSYLYEPPGSVHTLWVLPENRTTETLTVIHGQTEYLDDDGEVIAVTNAETNLQSYFEGCEQAGVPRPTGILR